MAHSLPPVSNTGERAVSVALDIIPRIAPGVAPLAGFKANRPLIPSLAPYVAEQYGLGPISKFFSTYEALIDQGRAWQRRRGTPFAVSTALSWIGYDAVNILDQVKGRRRWHMFQIAMGELPGEDEVARLNDAEQLVDLSDRARSFFWRGYHGYDVRAMVCGRSRIGRAMLGDSSGVRIGGKTKWSHGKSTSGAITATAAERNALGVNFTTGQVVTWNSGLSWNAPGLTWNGITNAAKVKAWALLQKVTHIAFYDAENAVIGYARVVMRPKDITAGGSPTDATIRYAVRTGFGDGFGKVAAKASLVFGCEATGVPAAKRWLEPAQASFPSGLTKVGEVAMNITFQKTVRQLVTIDLTI